MNRFPRLRIAGSTVGALVLYLAFGGLGPVVAQDAHIPGPGEMCTVDGWRLEVVAMERLRIATVRVVAP